MKIKASFVTNSSSSSFIVAWPHKIETQEDVDEFIDKKYSGVVFRDAIDPMAKNNPHALNHLVKELSNGYMPEVDNDLIEKQICERENITKTKLRNTPGWYRQFWNEVGFKTNKAAYAKAESFLEEISNESYIYIFEYSDSDGEFYSEMEHGNIFGELPHIRISKH